MLWRGCYIGCHKGVVLVVCLIFLAVFAAVGLSLATSASSNLLVAHNQVAANRARAAAESGQEILRYILANVSIPATTPAELYLQALQSSICSVLEQRNISVVDLVYQSECIRIPMVCLDRSNGTTFEAGISLVDPDTLQVDVYGTYRQVCRHVRTQYDIQIQGSGVFDYGLATRGPLAINGNVELEGVNVDIESSVYIESLEDIAALSMIGNCSIAGEVKIVNPLAIPDIGGNASVGGETGDGALKHIWIGVPACDFPEPDVSPFRAYATNVIDPEFKIKRGAVLRNVRIPRGTNPSFPANITFLGVVFVETPNVVTFTGNVSITGVIVGDGDVNDDSGSNQIIFRGNVECRSVSELPEEFGDLRSMTGTFIVAPGFAVDFGGTFLTHSGAIAANGVSFSGNAGGTIRGSIINYANTKVTISGNTTLRFNRSGIQARPAGFTSMARLVYKAASYTELAI